MQSEISVDWMSFSFAREDEARVIRTLEHYFGEGFEHGNARGFYSATRKHPSGFVVMDGHLQTDRSLVQLSGVILAELSPDAVIGLMLDLEEASVRFTRLDVALDYRGDRVLLVDHVLKACKAQRHCGLRRWTPHQDFRGAQRINHGISIGTRGGDGAGRYVRVYDKGLETGTLPEGKWQRFEVEFSGEVASQAVAMLACSRQLPDTIYDHAWRCLASFALGSVDFRYRTDGRALSRTRRCSWFARMIGGAHVVRLRRTPVVRSVERTMQWLRESVSSIVAAITQGAGIPVADLIAPTEVDPAKSTLGRAQVYRRTNAMGLALVPEFLPC